MKVKISIISIIGLFLVNALAASVMGGLDPNNNLIGLRLVIHFMLGFLWPWPIAKVADPVPIKIESEKKENEEQK